ncbi:hypothetical protein AGMMS49975_09020 [Clostridia bacterium]|nr:hypothetical protein AGMMS49975_09020 [Clostridia bacterium]
MAVGHDKMTADGKKFFKQLEELKKLQVRVGYQAGAAKEENGTDILDVAMWNELGTSNAPARPFLRQSVERNKDTIEKFCKAQVQAVANGGTAEQALNAIGVMQTGLIQDTITKSPEWAEENADITKELKGSDVPLIDTGKLLQSPHHVIVPKGGGG